MTSVRLYGIDAVRHVLADWIGNEREPAIVGRSAVDVDGALPAEQWERRDSIAPVGGADQPHLHVQVGRMPERAGGKLM